MKGFFKILWRFVVPYKKQFVLNVIFNLLATFLTIFSFALIIPILEMLFEINTVTYSYTPWGTSSITDFVVNNFYYYVQNIIATSGKSIALACMAAALVVMSGLKTGSAYMAIFFIVSMRTGIVRDMRTMIYNKMVSLPISFFSDERKGDVMARISGDVIEVESSIMMSLDMLFKNPIMIVVYLTVMLFLSWKLTLFVFILLPIAGFIMGRTGKYLKRASLEQQNQYGTIMSNIEETISGLRIIKAFNAEGKMKHHFAEESEKYRNISRRMNRRYELAHPMSEFLGTATIAIVLWFGGTLILGGTSAITAPKFIYYMVIFYSIINPAKELSKVSYNIQRGLASMERIDKIMNAVNPITDPEKPVALNALSKGISYKNVRFRYQETWVLDDVSIDIPCGKTVALVGQSGSGKTTIADLLPRFYDVNEGAVTIDGIDIRNYRVADLRGLMGNVNQEAILFNDSFFNNIAFGVENATREEVENAAKIANAYDFIMGSEFGFDTNIGDRGCKLSGGQRQRISIARAILKNPPILILDEATSALDTESEHLVQEALDKLMRGRTTLVIAHRLSTIKNADLIVVMHEGKVVEQGKHDELIALGGNYKHLVDMQKF